MRPTFGYCFTNSAMDLRVIRRERGGSGELGGDAVFVGERFWQEDVEHLHEPDAALVAFAREPVEHLDVLREDFGRDLHGFRIIFNFTSDANGVAIPEVPLCVHAVRDEGVEILGPERLVVEPREQLRRVGILANFAAGQDVSLLHPDARAAEGHFGPS